MKIVSHAMPLREFTITLNSKDLDEIRIAFLHMLNKDPQWYTNDQQLHVTRLHEIIKEALK